jgi:hypothetical protein
VNSAFIRSLAALAVLAAAAPLCAQRWQMQYLYDESKSDLTIDDLQIPTATHGIAVGIVTEGKERKPVEIVTSDGGAHWQIAPLKEEPISVFFLNADLGWLVTDKGIWKTSDAGKTWGKMPHLPEKTEALRVYFADENRGWAACTNQTVLETTNGGEHWTSVPEAAKAPGNPLFSAYSWIAFSDPQSGIITGSSEPALRERLPDWLVPDQATREREIPHLSLTLQTRDGGKTWKSESSTIMGEITRSRFSQGRLGMGLIEHGQSFQYPSEVFSIEWPSGGNRVVYRDERFFVSDVWIAPGGSYYLAGIELASKLRDIVPQKVKVLVSKDLSTWTPVPTDYRATANRVYLGGSGDDALWLATNTGMILRLGR